MMARKKFQWSRDEEDSEGELHFTERTNRTQRKRDADRLDALTKALVSLKADQLSQLPLTDPVKDALNEARRIKAKGRIRSGMRRQMLFVSGTLRREEEAHILELVAAVERMTKKRI